MRTKEEEEQRDHEPNDGRLRWEIEQIQMFREEEDCTFPVKILGGELAAVERTNKKQTKVRLSTLAGSTPIIGRFSFLSYNAVSQLRRQIWKRSDPAIEVSDLSSHQGDDDGIS